MLSFRALLRKFKVPSIVGFAAFVVIPASILLPDALGHGLAKAQESGTTAPQTQEPEVAASHYDKAFFLKPIPSDQLAFLNQFAGVATKDVIKDKQFRKLMKSVVPDCMFHYGRDMPLSDALEMVFKDSPQQVQVRDGRYLILSGKSGPYLSGRGFIWIDMQDGIGLGGFYFHPTNGEPTPSMNVFSRQVKETSLALGQLPPAFAEDLNRWSKESSVPAITTRYFLTGSNKKILLEHDEDFCAPVNGKAAPANSGCEEQDAEAADLDMNAANYLDQTNYATNATAWMVNGEEQVAWLQVREHTCGAGPGQLRCHIRMTHERTHVIVRRGSSPHPTASHSGHR